MPLLVGGTVLGVLHVGTLTPRPFSGDDTTLLQLVADRIALAVLAEHRRLLEQQREDLEITLAEITQHEQRCRDLLGGKTRARGKARAPKETTE